MKQEWRGVGASERAVECQGRQGERHRKTLSEHHLKNITCRDVILCPLHHGHECFGCRIRGGLGQRERDTGHAGCVGQRLVERGDDTAQSFHCLGICGVRIESRLRIDRSNNDHLILHRVEHDHNGRADEHAVGDVERIRPFVGQVLDQPHGVIAHIAKHACRYRWQLGRQFDARLREQRPQRLQGWAALRFEGRQIRLRPSIDFRPVAERSPYDVRRDADDRVAPANGAAFHRIPAGSSSAARRSASVLRTPASRDRRQVASIPPAPTLYGSVLQRQSAQEGPRSCVDVSRAWSWRLVLPARAAAAYSSGWSRPGVPRACFRAASLTERP